MFGNLFGSRKYTVEDQRQVLPQSPVPQSPVVPPPPVSASAASSLMEPNVRQGLSVLSHLDTRATQVLNLALQEAKRIKQALIEPDQLMIGLGDFYWGTDFKRYNQKNLR